MQTMQEKVNHYLDQTPQNQMEVIETSLNKGPLSAEGIFSEFKRKLDQMLDEDTFIGSEDDIDYLSPGTFTLLIDTLFYFIAKEYNLSLLPENAVGRGGYSDILLCSKDGTKKFVEIEHENLNCHRNRIRKAIVKSLRNLRHSEANIKILITYYETNTRKLILDICKEYQKRYMVKNLYLFIANQDFDNADEFELIIL